MVVFFRSDLDIFIVVIVVVFCIFVIFSLLPAVVVVVVALCRGDLQSGCKAVHGGRPR